MAIIVPTSSIEIFRQALDALNREQVSYAIGGAFAMNHYTGMSRNTNDLDIYIQRSDLQTALRVLHSTGFLDSGEMAAGDREWIYHAKKNGVMVDLIWQSPNHMNCLDETFSLRAVPGSFLDRPAKFLPADSLIWTKVFTINRGRCDWPDIFNIVRAKPDSLDWGFLVEKIGDNWPVMLSFVLLFDWVYPGEREAIPDEVRNDLFARKREAVPLSSGSTRESLLDPWLYSRPVLP